MPSQYRQDVPSNGNDGDYESQFYIKNMTNPWWRLDLEATYEVHAVHLVNNAHPTCEFQTPVSLHGQKHAHYRMYINNI